MIRDKRGTTAFFCFSTQIKPGRSELRIFGPGNSITVDQASGTVLSHKNRKWKSYLTYFGPPLLLSAESFKAARSNVAHSWAVACTELMSQFYGSIRAQTEPPISARFCRRRESWPKFLHRFIRVRLGRSARNPVPFSLVASSQ